MQSAFRKFVGSVARRPRLLAALLALWCTGCCTTGPLLSASRQDVVIFRGAAGYFPNLCEFEDRLLAEGVCPIVAFPEAHAKIGERIIAARNTGRLPRPLVIVGYSLGADKALLLARRLQERGIIIDKLVLIETSSERQVPDNVRECVNVYIPHPWRAVFPFFRGCPVSIDGPETALMNYDVREHNDGRYDWDNHFTITANPYIQDLLIDEVMSAFDEVPEQAEPALAAEASLPADEGAPSAADDSPQPAEG